MGETCSGRREGGGRGAGAMTVAVELAGHVHGRPAIDIDSDRVHHRGKQIDAPT